MTDTTTATTTDSTESTAAETPAQTWYSQEDSEYVAAKGWDKKTPDVVLKSYRELEKFKGAPEDRLLVIPDKEDPEAWNKIYTKLGRPESVEKYKVEVKLPEDAKFGINEDALNEFKKLAFENGMTSKQVQAAVDFQLQLAGKASGMIAESEAQLAQRVEKETNELKAELGDKFDEFIETGRRAVRFAGLEESVIDALENQVGTRKTFETFAKLGALLNEQQGFEGKGTNTGYMTPDKAKSRMDELKTDSDFVKRYMNNDLSAINEMRNLEKIYLGG